MGIIIIWVQKPAEIDFLCSRHTQIVLHSSSQKIYQCMPSEIQHLQDSAKSGSGVWQGDKEYDLGECIIHLNLLHIAFNSHIYIHPSMASPPARFHSELASPPNYSQHFRQWTRTSSSCRLSYFASSASTPSTSPASIFFRCLAFLILTLLLSARRRRFRPPYD